MNEQKKIQMVIPCHNEEDNIELVVTELEKCLSILSYSYEFFFVDDGSTDGTFDRISSFSEKRNDVHVIKLSRNFGKEAAIAAGLKECDGDAAIIIDSDLQHPPDLIPSMIRQWEMGAQIVDAVKERRQKENIIIRAMSLFFNKLMSSLTGMDFKGASDYKLLDRQAIMVLNNIEEKNRFFRGLTNWIGMRHSQVSYRVQERRSGKTKWNWLKLFYLSIDAISSYSSKPLQIVTLLGGLTLAFSFVLGAQTLYNRFFGAAVSGFTTVILVVLIFSSIIMISIGILGIYISKLYEEVKNRPIYVVDQMKQKRKTADDEEDPETIRPVPFKKK